jgi:predicted kinase
MIIGLPRSGKSTEARFLGYPIVAPDAIRSVIHGTPWRENIEPLIWAQAKIMVESLFKAGHDHVTLDACNHTEERRRIWHSEKWAIKYHLLQTSKEVCVQRAVESDQKYLIPVIERMYSTWKPLEGEDS